MISEDQILQHYNFFEIEHNVPHQIVDGSAKVMISAPHCVELTRDGCVKPAEPQAGVLARLLHESTGCPVIYKLDETDGDPNYSYTSLYKKELIDYIKTHDIRLLIDLHQLAASREVMIDIGTAKLTNLSDMEMLNVILAAFSAQNVGVIQIDKPFGGSRDYTIASAVRSNCSIQAVQLEVNSRLLHKEFLEYNFEGVFNALKDIITKLSDMTI